MKRIAKAVESGKRGKEAKNRSVTVGMDLGDRTSRCCEVDEQGKVVREGSVGSTRKAMTQRFGAMTRCLVAIEVGSHSRWVSQLLKSFGHEVIVANALQLKLISESSRKTDRTDAETLARMARVDPQLLRPIQHRSERAQTHLTVIRVRAALVEARTGLVNAARGLTKATGERLPSCDTDQMGVERMEGLPAELQGSAAAGAGASGIVDEMYQGIGQQS